MLVVDNSNDSDTGHVDDKNDFLDSLEPASWRRENGFMKVTEQKIDLDLLYHGQIQDFLNKDFYFYMGSDTTPPC